MAPREKSERIDILPVLLAVLAVVWSFYLVRPSLSLFLYSSFGKDRFQNRGAEFPQQAQLAKDKNTKSPDVIAPPEVPQLLYQSLAAWPKCPSSVPEMESLEREIDRLTNLERRRFGQQDLPFDSDLREIARRHSWEMASKGYVGHLSPDGIGPAQRVGKQNRCVFALVGENVAEVPPSGASSVPLAGQFVETWLNSPEHRRNLLSSGFNKVAAGCFQQSTSGGNDCYCTQLFMRVYALAEQEIPEVASVGQIITVRLRPAEGFPIPTRLIQVNLRNGDEPSSATLAEDRGTAVGRITLQGSPDVYLLQLEIRDPKDPGRHQIIAGPYVIVK